jgi:ABC-type transport system involved in multi-copper enzyme maturation permease subunit
MISPIIEKDMKTKMRGWKSPALISIYLLFLTMIGVFVYYINSFGYYTNTFTPKLMYIIFTTISSFQLMLVFVIVPALTSSSINSERERQTLDLLLCTNLSTYKIVIGKLVVAIMHILLLYITSLPILSVVFLYGGVGILELLSIFIYTVISSIFAGSIGVLFSTIFKKRIVSVIFSYLTISIITVLSGILMIIWFLVRNLDFYNGTATIPGNMDILPFMAMNPLYGISSLVKGFAPFDDTFGVLSEFVDFGFLPDFLTKPWMINSFFFLMASIGLILMAGWKLKPVKKMKNGK